MCSRVYPNLSANDSCVLLFKYKETYKSYVYENQNIFDLSFDMLIKLIFDKYPDLLNDTILKV